MKPYCLLGATGTTGITIANLLDQSKIPLLLVASNSNRLNSLNLSLSNQHTTRVIDLSDPQSVKQAISGSAVVVNCIGPFTRYGQIVIEACLDQHLNYLDITGEQHFIHSIDQKFDQQAKDRGISIVPSAAFEFALGDSAIAWLNEEFDELDNIEITYSFKNISTSRGTINSIICALSSPAYLKIDHELVLIEPGKFVEQIDANDKQKKTKARSRFAFPGGEIFLSAKHTKVKTIKTYLENSNPTYVTSLLAWIFMHLAKTRSLNSLMNKLAKQSLQALDQEVQARTSFNISVTGQGKKDGLELSREISIKGTNPYRLSAAIIGTLSKSLAGACDGIPKGVISPSMVKGHKEIVSISEKYGCRWQLL